MSCLSPRFLSLGLLGFLAAVAIGALTPTSATALEATLSSSADGPVPLGTMVFFTASASGPGSDRVWYRFRVRERGSRYQTIRDFGPGTSLNWTASDHEGDYEVELVARGLASGETAVTRSTIRMDERTHGPNPVISPTLHPLVFLYSDASCRAGFARVLFYSDDGKVQSTPTKRCRSNRTVNFYLAGLRAETHYTAIRVSDRGRREGRPVSFTSGSIPPEVAVTPVEVAVGAAFVGVHPRPNRQELLMQAPIGARPFATDLDGQLVWLGPGDLTYMTRPGDPGRFFGLAAAGPDPELDFVREFDLVGMTLRETNVARVNEQLDRLGARGVSAFHHEARSLPGGRILLLAAVEQILTDVQGPGPVDVVGDMVIVLDRDLNVVWTWDTFDHLDPRRKAILGEDCSNESACTPHYLSATANDWTHGNSLAATPDGNILYSSRHQDWLIKIAYERGTGDGAILWRLGKDGDFTFDSDDPYPWFSHQHDAEYESGGPATITLFDNGNTRVASGAGKSSRGQAIELDEDHGVARLVLNADLGMFSIALGAAEKLLDGGYHFDAGFLFDPADLGRPSARSIEVTPTGELVSSIKAPTTIYRSFRMADMYGLR